MRRLLVLFLFALPLSAQTVTTPDRGPFQPGKVIVEFRDPPLLTTAAPAKSVASAYAATVNRLRADVRGVRIRHHYFRTFNGVSLTAGRKTLERIRALGYVKAIHPDVPMQAFGEPDPSPNLQQISVPGVWSKYGTRGSGIVVAIVDTGVDYTHPALGGGIGPGYRVLGGHDFAGNDDDPKDEFGHGTHVAGIIGGLDDTIVGVAPDVSFLAYRVLDEHGRGTTSDVLAGIEAAVDPNGDGDLRDHADVVNISLGGPGNPDDPLARAIDAGTAAGVVFVVAAGNSGVMHSVGSPGVARTAITVGSVNEGDALSAFSSRGPNNKDLGVKPDVAAPGEAIKSAFLSHGYATMSGTSMATPHVAGVAALLRAIHPDWTPARIKSAIVSTAAVQSNDVMGYGGGRVNALAAAQAMLIVDPPLLTFGLDGSSTTDHWIPAARTLHLSNPGAQTLSLSFTPQKADHIAVTVTPSTVEIPPGGVADISVHIDADNALITAKTTSGGNVDIGGLPAGAHFGWAFTKAARLYTTYDRGMSWPFLFGKNLDATIIPVSEREAEALLLPGTYHLLLFSVEIGDDGETGSDARLISRENIRVDGDVALALSGDEATHLITFAARDTGGALLRDAKPDYVSFTRLTLPDWGPSAGILLPWGPGPDSIRVGSLDGVALTIGEVVTSFDDHRIVAVVHDPIAMPIAGDLELRGGGRDLLTANVRLAIPGSKANLLAVVGPGSVAANGANAIVFIQTMEEPTWFSRLEMTPNMTGESAAPVSFELDQLDGRPLYTTPPLVVKDGRIVARDAHAAGDGGGVFQFGFGPLLPSLRLQLSRLRPGDTWSSGTFDLDIRRGLGDISYAARQHATTTVTDATGKILMGPAFGTQMEIFFGAKTGCRAETVVDDTLYPSMPRKTTMTLGYDTHRADFVSPTFTSVILSDEYGRMANELTPHASGTLLFSVADYIDGNFAGETWQPPLSDSVHVAYRYRGTTTWLPLTAVLSGQDQSGVLPNGGSIYRVDLKNVANVDDAVVDMKIDVSDPSGNTATMLMEPAFAVHAVGTIRHRAGGK